MIYAPIIIPTLNRYECLKKCVESLQKNTWADETELYISVDYPPAEKYEYGYRKIKEYLDKEITGFKKVNVFFQGKNLGPIENVNWLYEKAFSKYDRVIFMEDDNEVAPSFIQFCDKGLELFDRYEDIIAINASDYVWCGKGFTPPINTVNFGDVNIEKRQMIFHAFATWKNKKEKVYDWAENGMLYMLGKSNYKMLKLYKKSTSLFYTYLYRVCITNDQLPWYKGRLHAIDFCWDLYMVMLDKYVIAPIEPLIRDLGVDGNGVNYTDAFSNSNELKCRPLKKEKTFDYVIEKINISDRELKLHDSQLRKEPIWRRWRIIWKFLWNYRRRV